MRKPRLSPTPTNKDIVSGNKATLEFIRFLNDLREGVQFEYNNSLELEEKVDKNTDDIDKNTEQISDNTDSIKANIKAIEALIKELDNTQTGAGLESDGSYKAPTVSNYLKLATSLYNADILLDNAIFTNTRELVMTTTLNRTLSAESQTVLSDASNTEIFITMPPPAECFKDGRSLRFAIHKIDTTENKVIILPNNNEKVVGESQQELLLDGEIYNFITDGASWHLGA